jgi:hypothetical protein
MNLTKQHPSSPKKPVSPRPLLIPSVSALKDERFPKTSPRDYPNSKHSRLDNPEDDAHSFAVEIDSAFSPKSSGSVENNPISRELSSPSTPVTPTISQHHSPVAGSHTAPDVLTEIATSSPKLNADHSEQDDWDSWNSWDDDEEDLSNTKEL